MVTRVPPVGDVAILGRKARRMLKGACIFVLSVRSIEDLLNDSAPNEHNGSPLMLDAALLIRIVGLPSCIEH